MTIDLRKLFTRETVVSALQQLPVLSTPVMDAIFPEAKRVLHPFPVIGYDDLGLPTSNIPVVRRGTGSYALKTEDGSLKLIEPQPVNPSISVSGATINNLQMLDKSGIQTYINGRIEALRGPCRMTAEALCAQALTGKISYPMKSDGATLLYEVDYGTPSAVTVAKKWDTSTTKVADIIKSLGEIVNAMKQKGYGQDVLFACDYDVFGALVDKVAALPNSSATSVGKDFISLGGGITIMLLPASYKNLTTSAMVSAIPAKSVVAIDRNAGHKLMYAALDDVDSGFVALPLFARAIKQDDPSGWKIIGESKPLPVVNVKGIITASVLE